MQTTLAPDTRDRTRCAECGASISFDVDAAYDDLYGNVVWRPAQMARLIERELSADPERSDAAILAAVFRDFFDYDPAALVAAVRHRQTEFAC